MSRHASRPKRNKPHTGGRIAIPMMFMQSSVAQSKPLLCDSLLAQISSLCLQPCIETGNNLSRELAIVAGGLSHMVKGRALKSMKDAGSIAICSAIQCMNAIAKRYESAGFVGLTAAEKATLQAAAPHLHDVLSRMPMACYLKGEDEAENWLNEANEPQQVAA